MPMTARPTIAAHTLYARHIRPRADAVQAEEPEWERAGRSPRFPSGWWILPGLILSLAIWAGVLWLGWSAYQAVVGAMDRAAAEASERGGW